MDFSIPHFVVQPPNIRLDGGLGGGAVMDVGCCAVDLIRAAWGAPVVEFAVAVLYEDDPRVDLQTDALLRLPLGAPAAVRSSFTGEDTGRMSMRGTGSPASLEATSVIVSQWRAERRIRSGDDLTIDETAAPGENSYARQLAHLAAVLRDGSSSPLDEIYRAAGLLPR